MAGPTDGAPEAYRALRDRKIKIGNVVMASMVLGWDQRVMMPDGGAPARAQQRSTLSALSHELLIDDDVGRWLEDIETESLTADQAAVVREIRREYTRATDVPAELVKRVSTHQSEAQQAWQKAKAENNYEHFAPSLSKLLSVHTERARAIDPTIAPYRVLFEDTYREPDLSLDQIGGLFAEVRDHIVPLIQEIKTNGRELPSPFTGRTYDEKKQLALSETILDQLGFQWKYGRFDTEEHPGMSGNQFDVRITTRVDETDLLSGLMATIHEFGHATYQLGLRRYQYGTPLGIPRSAGIHESQARFWENHVGRSRAFWEFVLPTMIEYFPRLQQVTVNEAHAAVNAITPENVIRVAADELTYHLHIILRCEIERGLVAGDLDVSSVPHVWNEKMEEYLGVIPETDSEGCLQDIHWTSGFAGFQSYTIGSILAAQLAATMREDLTADVDKLVRRGEFDPLREWMTEHVHRHGQRYPTDELIERATGEPLTAEYFIDYVDKKFRELYNL